MAVVHGAGSGSSEAAIRERSYQRFSINSALWS